MIKLGDGDIKQITKCFTDDFKIDLRKLLECYSLSFNNLSFDDILYLEGELRREKEVIENHDRVVCFKTTNIFCLGFDGRSYFSYDEEDLVKKLYKEAIDRGVWSAKVEVVTISGKLLEGYIRDRKEWEVFK